MTTISWPPYSLAFSSHFFNREQNVQWHSCLPVWLDKPEDRQAQACPLSMKSALASGPTRGSQPRSEPLSGFWALFFLSFYLFIHETQRERERGRDIGRGRRGSLWGAQCETLETLYPWALGSCPEPKADRHSTTEPPRHP